MASRGLRKHNFFPLLKACDRRIFDFCVFLRMCQKQHQRHTLFLLLQSGRLLKGQLKFSAGTAAIVGVDNALFNHQSFDILMVQGSLSNLLSVPSTMNLFMLGLCSAMSASTGFRSTSAISCM